VKSAAVIEERRRIRIASAPDYLANEAGVVADRHDLTHTTVEPSRSLGQDRRFDLTPHELHSGEPSPTTRAIRVRKALSQPMIGLAELIDCETAALGEAFMHAAPERKEDRQERWVERGNDTGARRCRMGHPIDHRDYDGNAARNLTRGTAK